MSRRPTPQRRGPTKATVTPTPSLHLSMFTDGAGMMLTSQQVAFVKAGLLYGDNVDLFCPAAQFTVWLDDLRKSPNRILHNLVRGYDTGSVVLSKHGKAEPWAIRRILNQHIPELPDLDERAADEALNAFKAHA